MSCALSRCYWSLFRHSPITLPSSGALRPLAITLQRFGWTGVDLFFVLSGFLIGGLLFQDMMSGRFSVRRFLIRRALKIWPAYFVFLAFIVLQLVRHEHMSAREILHELMPNLIHVQNYVWSCRGHTWTLAVEEHFYLALAYLAGNTPTVWTGPAEPRLDSARGNCAHRLLHHDAMPLSSPDPILHPPIDGGCWG